MACRVRAAVVNVITAAARDASPAECCGVLIGRRDLVVGAVPTPNLSTDPNRFSIDPQAHIATRRRARARGLAVTGFFHSHPHSAPEPSETDADATYQGHLCAIVGVVDGEYELRLFRLTGGLFVPVPFTVE